MGDGTVRLRADGVVWREVAGEVVVLDVSGSMYFSVNGSGTVLWRALAAGATREEMAQALVEGYEVSADQAAEDVEEFVRSLADLDLLGE